MVRIGSFQNIDASAKRVVLSDDGKQARSANVGRRIVSSLRRSSSSENVAVKKAFVNSLRMQLGSDAASHIERGLDMSGRTPLTGRTIKQVLNENLTLHRRGNSLQGADIKMLLGKSGAIDANGTRVTPHLLQEHVTFLKQAVGNAKTELADKLAFASDAELRSLLASGLNVAEDSSDVTSALAAIRSGFPNTMSADGSTMELNGKRYTKGAFLGEGGFGKAHIYESADGDSVVVKSLAEPNRDFYDTPGEFNAEKQRQLGLAREECQAHRYATQTGGQHDATGSEYVAGFGGPVRSADGTIHLAIQHCSVGDVTNIWGSRHGDVSGVDRLVTEEALSSETALKLKGSMAHDFLKGLSYLQLSRNMVHLDLKPHNVFMDAEGRCKIGDFGLADATMVKQLPKQFQTTRQYQAPEVDRASGEADVEERRISAAADSYSAGYMLHELITGSRAFDQGQASAFGVRRDTWFANHEGLAKGEQSTGNVEWDKLINGLTHRDPAKRISLDDALKSPVFQSILNDEGTDVRPEVRSLLPKIAAYARLSKKAETERNDLVREGLLLDQINSKLEIQGAVFGLE